MDKQQTRFVGLDGLRGIAALIVFGGHGATLLGYHGLVFAQAVDLFFMISGFVIPHAYETKLRGGLSFRAFFAIRLIRLYPLYILGVAISLVPYLYWAAAAGHLYYLRSPAAMLCWAVFLLPQPHYEPQHSFLLNPPAWSLFLEMVVNIAYALALPWLTNRVLVGVAIVTACGLAVAVGHFGTIDFGTGGVEMLWALFRVGVPFTAGVLLYRTWAAGRFPAWRLSPLAPAAIFLSTVAVLSWHTAGWAELLVTTFIAAGLVVAAICSPPRGAAAAALEWLGDLSYPLYVLHLPLLIVPRQLFPKDVQAAWWFNPASLLSVLVIAALAIAPDVRLRRVIVRTLRPGARAGT